MKPIIEKLVNENPELKELMQQMTNDIVFSLQYLDCKGSGMRINGSTMKHWKLSFCETLDQLGIEVDRDQLFAGKKGKK